MDNSEGKYNNADLNELFNFSYNFDLLKGIIETLLKNQQNIQKELDQMKEDHKALQLLKFEFKEAKEELKKINDIYPVNSNKDIDGASNLNELNNREEKEVEKNEDFGFNKIKNFEQMKQKMLEFRKDFEKTKNELYENKNNFNLISNKYDKILGESESNNIPLNDRFKTIEKKLKFLLGNTTLEDIERIEENNKKDNNENNENEEAKPMNLHDMKRRIIQLEFNKVNVTEIDKANNQIDELKSRINELILNLYGNTEELYEIDKDSKFVKEKDFDKYKKNIGYEIERIWAEINQLKELIQSKEELIKDKCTFKDLDNNNAYLLKKFEELLEDLNKKYVNKSDNSKAFKNLEAQFKKIILLLAAKTDNDNENWLIVKKPMNGYTCASCESYIGDLKEEKNENKYINWKKMPIREREREKEKEVEKEKMYRLGNGYSHVLKMVGFDNHGNVSLNPNSNKDLNFLFPGNYENNKIKESNDLQIKKPNYQERIQSAHSKESKEKIYDYIKTKNYDRKLPKIKGTMSTDDFDKIIDNPNPSINSNDNGISPKITKIMKKSHSKFNI